MNEVVNECGVQAPGRNRKEWLEKEVSVLGGHLYRGENMSRLYMIQRVIGGMNRHLHVRSAYVWHVELYRSQPCRATSEQ